MGGLPIRLALSSHGFRFHYRHAGSIHLHIQDRNRLADHHRQIQLHGALDPFPLADGDILSNRLRRPLHGFGGHLQIGQQFHLLTPVIEGRLLAYGGQHSPYAG